MNAWETAIQAACIQAAATLMSRGGQIPPTDYPVFARLSIDLYEAYLREFGDRKRR